MERDIVTFTTRKDRILEGNACLPLLSPETFEKARRVAPGWDIYYLECLWRDWTGGQGRAEKLGCRSYRLLPPKVSTGRKALKEMASQERRSPKNNQESLKDTQRNGKRRSRRLTSLAADSKPRRICKYAFLALTAPQDVFHPLSRPFLFGRV
jgi:hypothetical protein